MKARKGGVVRLGIVLVAAGILVGALASIAVAALAGDGGDGRTVAELDVEPSAAGGPRGAALLTYDEGRLRGRVVVVGLEPGSAHAVHFHGPDSSCGEKAEPVAIHPDLEAGPDGVASAHVDVETAMNVLRPGFYYNVHAAPATVADNPEIACGDVRPVP
jgi:hypothetical protein